MPKVSVSLCFIFFNLAHHRDTEGTERKFLHKKLCALCVSAVNTL